MRRKDRTGSWGRTALRLEVLEGRAMLHVGVDDPCDRYLDGYEPLDGAADMHMDPVSLPATLTVMGTENMPNPVTAPTARTIDCGNWSDPAIWEGGRVPGPTDTVLITRHVLLDTTGAQAQAILITADAALIFDPHRDTGLKVGTLVVTDNGILQIGTERVPVDPNVTASLVIADQPLDFAKDPKQYLTGLLALGDATVRICGAAKTTDASDLRLAKEPLAGATTLTLEHAPTGWRVGDRVVLPSTDPSNGNRIDPNNESEEFHIAAVAGNVVTLDRPLARDHRGAYDAHGTLTFLPHLINLSRNVVIRSENPNGTRGHVLLTDMAAVDIRYAEFTDLGRTTGAPLDNTTFDATGAVTHVGTNQVGRYSLHLHHLMGPHNETDTGYQYTLIGNAISDGRKWGLTIHQTSYGLVHGNDLYDFQSAGIATESGNEAYNIIEQNVVFKVGAGFDVSDGFWFAGPLNYVRDNVAANTRDSEYLGYGFHLDGLRVTDPSDRFPRFRGADITRDDQTVIMPHGSLTYLEFRGNEAYGMTKGISVDHYGGTGMLGEMLIQDLKVWGTFGGAGNIYGGVGQVTIDGLTVRKSAQTGFYFPIWSGTITVRHADIQDADLQNGMLAEGIGYGEGSGPGRNLVIEDSYLDNAQNIRITLADNQLPQNTYSTTVKNITIRNVKFDNPTGQPFNAITLTNAFPTPTDVLTAPQIITVEAFNQIPGDNFQLYWKEQAADAPAYYVGTPLGPGPTNAQTMNSTGKATGGAITYSKAVRAGIVNGYVALLVPGPTISAVTATYVSPTQVTINWLTDRPGNTQLEYGFTTGYEQTTSWVGGPLWDRLPVTNHLVSLTTGLSPNGLYHYRVRTRDAAGNETVSGDFTFTTVPPTVTTPPPLNWVYAENITPTKASLRWEFRGIAEAQPGAVQLEYGPTTGYGSTVAGTSITHALVWLTDLTPNTVYHYRLVARDGLGNQTVTADRTFTTLPGPTVTVTGPAAAATVVGPDVTLAYTKVGDYSEVDHMRLWLDGRTPVGEYLTGSYQFGHVPTGTHTVTGYLVRGDGWKIPGSDFTVAFTTTAPNTAPVAQPHVLTTTTGTPVDVDLRTLAQDAETAPDALTFTVGGAAFGTVLLLADGHTARFTPAAGYAGPASFTFSVTDTPVGPSPALTTGPVTVPVTVSAVSPGSVTPPSPGPVTPPSPGPVTPPPGAGFPPALLAVGTDGGPVGTATVYNPDRTPRFTVTPFPGFTGGIRVAMGDVTGDGVPDLIAGAGPGGPALVRVFDGVTGAVVTTIDPFDGFTGGVFVTAGDLTGDGVPDVIVTPDQGGGPRVVVYRGGDFTRVANFFGLDDPAFRGGVRAAVGDLNGDGFADLVVSGGFGGGPRVSVYDGKALARGQQVHLVPDFFLFEPGLRNGAYLAVGDVNGDGQADIIGGGGPGGSPRVLVLSGKTLLSSGVAAAMNAPVANYFAGDLTSRGGVRVAAKNLDGDRYADVVVGPGFGAGSRVTAYLGKNLSTGNMTPVETFDPFPSALDGIFVG